MRKFPALLAALLAVVSFSSAQTRVQHHSARRTVERPAAAGPDVIFFNGIIYTGVGLAEDKPQMVQAMAIGGGKVLAVGTTDEITRLAGPNTHLRDLNSAGTDLHLPGIQRRPHASRRGRPDQAQSRPHGREVSRRDAGKDRGFRSATHLRATGSPAAAGITPSGTEKVLPTRQDLDKVTGGHPAFLERVDGHIAIANSAALAAAGITGKTVPPQGGAIDLDAHGEPTGILRESAIGPGGKGHSSAHTGRTPPRR